jgi:hypothetical protein
VGGLGASTVHTPTSWPSSPHYRWDGEETFGMAERSSPMDEINP